MLTGCRLSHQLREFNHRHHQLGFAFCSTKTTLQLSYFMLSPPSVSLYTSRFYTSSSSSSSSSLSSSSSNLDLGTPLVGCIQSNSPRGEIPVHPDTFSHQEDDREPPSELSSVAGGIVALGKFDALHIGHRELAIQAAKVGVPFLLSFVGMAEVLGWEPRAPIVAKCDRKRVLSSWAPYCGGMTPKEFEVDFSKVRYLSPQEFVDKLSKELGVRGVVAGKNYRFGFRAAGDASELVRLCQEYGLGAYIIDSVMDKYQDSREMGYSDSKEQGQVSSTRVRHALSKGDMKYVSELLGRQHRLILIPKDDERFTGNNRNRVSASKSCLLNLPPKEGRYDNCSLLIEGAADCVVPCRVVIDSTHIHLDLDKVDICTDIMSQEFEFLGIDFGDSGS